ncbi:MAG: hemolysin family protein [bacterium]|nr:hemolysin family protein [bacterium]MXZ78382.1 HlyC/CorC family transporter [Acidimicrobiia bacterium]MDE0612937.1 hemolysin family protein [bacterium]MXZ85792.1 HlyC/CorC family transporter [Acidimicrobiia bacterium]MYB11369.1 HlyC/CorC family transporter [Acidimicrobiia bacterium]
MTGLYIAVAVVLLVANAGFVAVEFALIAARRSRLEPLAEAGNRRARMALAAMGDINRQLAGAQLGITMASLGLGFVAEPAVARLIERAVESFVHLPSGVLHTISFAVSLALVVYLHMVLGEMVPKNVALAGAERTAMWLAPVNRLYAIVFGPLIGLLNRLSAGLVRLCGVEPIDELSTTHTAQEFAAVVEHSAAEGFLDEFDRSLLSSALELAGRPVRSVMVPRDQIVAVEREATVAEVVEVMTASGHSRVLVQSGSPDRVVGFVHAKDLFDTTGAGAEQPLGEDLIRIVPTIEEETSLEGALVLMQGSRRHLAVVRQGGRRTVGLVTLEDVLEVLVGDLYDETDPMSSGGSAGP